VGLHAIARLLGVGIESGLEVMDNGVEYALLRRGNVNLPAFFLQPELRVVDLLRFSGVSGDHQDSDHGWIPGVVTQWGQSGGEKAIGYPTGNPAATHSLPRLGGRFLESDFDGFA